MRGNGFQVFFVKAHGTHLHSAVGIDQKNRRHAGQAVGVRDEVAVFVVDQNGKRYAELLRKFRCGWRVVLGNSEKSCAATVTFVEAFQERKRELADGAGDFEECGDDGAAFQEGSERIILVVERPERKSGCRVADNDVRHVILFSHPA